MKTQSEIAQLFRRHFNGQTNFVTPVVVAYGETPKGLLYELSKPTADDRMFQGQYGVTFLRYDGVRIEHDERSSLRDSYDDAIAFISRH